MNAAKNCNAGCTGIDWAKAGIRIKLRKIRNYEDPVAVIGFDVVLGNLHAHDLPGNIAFEKLLGICQVHRTG